VGGKKSPEPKKKIENLTSLRRKLQGSRKDYKPNNPRSQRETRIVTKQRGQGVMVQIQYQQFGTASRTKKKSQHGGVSLRWSHSQKEISEKKE